MPSPNTDLRPVGALIQTLAAVLLTSTIALTGCDDSVSKPNASAPKAPDISLEAAIVSGDDHAVRDHLMARTPVDTRNVTGDTPLSIAAVMGRAYAAEILIGAGAELETTNHAAVTPLFNAAFFCHPDVLRVLIDAGARTDVTDQNGIPIQQIMTAPWDDIEPVYAALFRAIGMPFDVDRIEATRPKIAAMLR